MSDRRRKSFLAARLACKRLSRTLSGDDTQTDPRAITTVYADRPRPCCPLPDGRSAYSCSVSHDDRFAVAVASTGRVGVDVEKMSERVLKSRSLYMSEQEQALVRESRLGEIETAVRMWSIKEAVTKALDITLAEAWHRVQVLSAGSSESRFKIDDQDPCTAVHDPVGRHVFTLVCGCETGSRIFLINFSITTRVAHRKKIPEYLAPDRYIPARKTRCEMPYVTGPPTIATRGSRR